MNKIIIPERTKSRIKATLEVLPFLILLLSAIIIPKSVFDVSGNEKYLIFSGLFSLYFVLKLISTDLTRSFVKINRQNGIWIIFITYLFSSAFWATNTFYTIYGAFQVLFTFIAFRLFSTITWNKKNIERLKKTIFLIVISAILAQLYSYSEIALSLNYPTLVHKSKILMNKNFGLNHNYVGSLIVICLPYLILNKKNKFTFYNIALLTISALLITLSDSAQVTILILSLILLKTIFVFKINRTLKIGLLLAIVITATLIITTDKVKLIKIPVVHEFFDESDRLELWKNSTKMFRDSPLMGKGINNWSMEIGKYGYNNYDHSNDITVFKRYKHAHNFFFQLISELGLIGLLCIFGFVILPVINATRRFKSLPPFKQSALISIYILFLSSMVYGVVYNSYNTFTGSVVIAILGVAIISNMQNKKSIDINKNHITILLIFLSLTCFLFFTKTTQANNNIRIVEQLIKQKEYNKAQILTKNSMLFLDKSVSQNKMSQLYDINKDIGKSTQAINNAVNSDPYNLNLNVSAIKKKIKNKQLEQALEQCEKMKDLHPNYLPIGILAANIYKQLDYKKEFEEVYTEIDSQLDIMIKRNKRYLSIDNLSRRTLNKFKTKHTKLTKFKTELKKLNES